MERTTNLSLKKPGLDDDALISDLNDNSDILDSKIGPVGNVSLQTQISNEVTARQQADNALNNNIAKLRKGLSYVEDGTTIAANANYTAGKFICWQGEMYRIKVPINATVTSGNWTTYLDKMDGMGGALSQINADLTSLNDSLNNYSETSIDHIRLLKPMIGALGRAEISSLSENSAYILSLAADNNAAWHWCGVIFFGLQNSLVKAFESTGLEVSVSNGKIVIRNTNTGYAAMCNGVIIGPNAHYFNVQIYSA